MGKHEKKMVIELSAKQAELIEMLMETGAFESPEQLFDEVLAEFKMHRLNGGYTDAELKALIEEGLDTDGDIDADVFFEEIRQELEARAINEKA